MELVDKRGYLTICLTVTKEGKILLRKPEGIREWHQALKVLPTRAKQARQLIEIEIAVELVCQKMQSIDSCSK